MESGKEYKISVVLVTKNEEKTIESCLESLINQTKVPDEIIIVDGMSTDNTVEIVRKYQRKYNHIALFFNDKVYTPYGLNLGIRKSKGDFILIAGAHTIFNKYYIEKCINFLVKNHEAYAVGGITRSEAIDSNNFLEKAFAFVYSSPFGTAAKHRYDKSGEKEVDTVAYACYRKEVFEKIGYFDERLFRNQDIEFNYRMRKNGLKIYLMPIENTYFVPKNFSDFVKKNFSNGYWNFLTLKLAPHGISIRHFIPFIFTLYIFFLILFLIFSDNILFNLLFSSPILVYLLIDIYFSFKFAISSKNIRLFFYCLSMFPVLHISYGLGTLWSIIKSLQ
ncbi:glycosyltransferase family 2 protein [Petrotoga sp. 9PWA.NaAc.5.4]|uniref:glycosyltransferase family 2 protein n=1 Tax=Petrotoga sp. 9PWA.NaAc.5.4 TaxID=1434328 RepID=UPI000CAD9B8C|nr:glycosyltransferase family 2 protein [Petrotoga sp. 9PWA.NaAc.5.4]PNR94189.1 hypothetical protein X924_07135 [Petrotoga sp. 9PWA.NaAc.5.4]